jgi:ParB-like chromosome segregation protein Spo0J
MQVHILSIDKLIPHHRNLRKNDHAVDWIVASIQEFSLKIPLLARSNGEIVDGFLRWKVAQKLGMTEVPVILWDEWSEVRLMVNRSEVPVILSDGLLRRRRRTA